MMNVEEALEDKKEAIIKKLEEFREDGFVDESDLPGLLGKVWDDLLPAPAKFFMPEPEFVNVCMGKKDEFLNALNGVYNKPGLYLIK